MEYSLVQIIALVGGSALCLLALAVLSPSAVTHATEAVLDRLEVMLAHRARRRAARAGEEIHLSLFDAYRQERAHR